VGTISHEAMCARILPAGKIFRDAMRRRMSGQIVHDQHDFLSIEIVDIDDLLHEVGPVFTVLSGLRAQNLVKSG
jgi:hypothetical protein